MAKLTRLLWKELTHRWVTALLIVVLVACVSGILSAFRVNYSGLSREITRNARDIGSNVVILPARTDQVAYHANGGYTDETMPQAVVDQLVAFQASLNHLIPMLERRTDVANGQIKCNARVVGISASVPMPGRPKAPMQQAIEQDAVQLGSELAAKLGIKRDEPAEIQILNQTFRVQRVNRATGSWQDGVLLIDLKAAQELFQLPERISRIEAIECASEQCAITGENPQAVLTSELTRISDQATLLRREAMADARQGIRQLTVTNSSFLENSLWSLLVLAMLALGSLNSFQRQSEIGVLRALGYGRSSIVALFAGRSLVTASCGVVFGVIAGALIAYYRSRLLFVDTYTKFSIEWPAVALVGVIAVLLSFLAASLPALLAAGRHPADIIGKEV